jgi:hypothetical protein
MVTQPNPFSRTCFSVSVTSVTFHDVCIGEKKTNNEEPTTTATKRCQRSTFVRWDRERRIDCMREKRGAVKQVELYRTMHIYIYIYIFVDIFPPHIYNFGVVVLSSRYALHFSPLSSSLDSLLHTHRKEIRTKYTNDRPSSVRSVISGCFVFTFILTDCGNLGKSFD